MKKKPQFFSLWTQSQLDTRNYYYSSVHMQYSTHFIIILRQGRDVDDDETTQRKAQVCLVWWVEVEVGGNEKKEGNEEGEKRLCNVQYMSFEYFLIHFSSSHSKFFFFFFFFWTDDGNVLQERMGSRTR